jgi:membrane protein implicated in regulation of membrane protease activity
MLLDISMFWQDLNIIQKIYWVIAVPATVLFLIQLVLTFIGFDHDTDISGHADVSVDGDHGIGSQFLSFKNLLAFFTVFAWSGLACIEAGSSVFVSVLVSTFAGLLMVAIMVAIFYYMSKLSDSGTLDVNNAIHKIGTVYLTIPANRKGMGKVQIKVQGFQTLDALTDDDSDIKTGAIIEVVDIIGKEILLVKRSN